MYKEITAHRFSVWVNCGSDREEIYEDVGVLMLPQSYSENGRATRLVICCHGAGGTVETDDSQTERQILVKYLLANGYAVMDVNGLPKEYASLYGIDIRNNIGSPIAIDCYVLAYQYCVDNFNLHKEVLVHGASMGGISSTNLVMSGRIPVIAQSGFCPVLDAYGQIYLHPWSNGLPRTALGILYDLKKDDRGEYIYDEKKLVGYHPMARIEGSNGEERLEYPVPVKFWHCEDDPVVNIEGTKTFVRAINNAGCVARLRIFSTGGHEPQDSGEPIDTPIGNHKISGETLKITPAVEEAFLWLTSFDEAKP